MSRALKSGKVTPAKALLHQHKADEGTKRIFETIEAKEQRLEYNLYISGNEDDLADDPVEAAAPAATAVAVAVEETVTVEDNADGSETVTVTETVVEETVVEEPAAEATETDAPGDQEGEQQ